jgi:endonuclease YncB( thermonuclease family)
MSELSQKSPFWLKCALANKLITVRVLIFIALALPQINFAAILNGVVVGVSDGDTLKVLDSNKDLHPVRLMGIDAPEKAQPFGQRSKQSLSSLVFRQQVEVEWNKKDKYGRIVGKIRTLDGTDVCLAQISSGRAWHYKQYSSEQTPADRMRYSEAEAKARSNGVGVWRESSPMPPWEWRRNKKF